MGCCSHTAIAAIVVLAAARAIAGRAGFDVDAPGQQFLVNNTSDKPITPRLIIRGWTDGRAYPPRYAQGLRINGELMAPAMLTGATLIFEADGSATWGYGSGFGPRVEWQPDKPLMLPPGDGTLLHIP